MSIRLAAAAALASVATLVAPPATHTVRLERNRFVPAVVNASPGDTIRFVNGEGGPHNVAFDADSIPKEVGNVIDAAMPKPRSPRCRAGC